MGILSQLKKKSNLEVGSRVGKPAGLVVQRECPGRWAGAWSSLASARTFSSQWRLHCSSTAAPNAQGRECFLGKRDHVTWAQLGCPTALGRDSGREQGGGRSRCLHPLPLPVPCPRV